MARENNFLLGQGERLTAPVTIRTNSGIKNPPYSFDEAKRDMSGFLHAATKEFEHVPAAARPRDEVVAVVTMHPRYIGKSDFPEELLGSVGVRAIGSRLRKVTPRKWGVERHKDEAYGEDIFVAGPTRAFRAWANDLPQWTEQRRGAPLISHIEVISAFTASSKLRMAAPSDAGSVLLEVVLHNDHDQNIPRAFSRYVGQLGGVALVDRQRDVGGLSFIPVRIAGDLVEALAQFSFVRVARSMPTLRPLRPDITRMAKTFHVALPDADVHSGSRRVAIFDGGIPESVNLSRWVTLIEPNGIGAPSPDFQEHGLAVTSAFLFGALDPNTSPERPLCPVDHVRVLDADTTDDDLQYPDVLDRICDYLADNIHRYSFVNISLGPSRPIDDDEITQWTARLDEIFASGKALVTVAAGNDGERDHEAQLNRVQPPADAVNVLAVGSCDVRGAKWKRAPYSCIGPGRTPGLVKPDGVTFGGSDNEPFMALCGGQSLRARGVMGTSFAAPYALRSGVAVGVQLGDALSPLAIRTLLVHHAQDAIGRKRMSRSEVGWGRFPADPTLLITCEDNESLVIYQGDLPVGQHLSARIPLPENLPDSDVQLTATLVISPEIDPEHAGAYTRSGVLVTFRPDATDIHEYEPGRKAQRAKSDDFFSLKRLYSAGEYVLREDGHKWEPCIRATRKKHSSLLRDPHFDIKYHHRDGPRKAQRPRAIPYCLVVGVRAPGVPDLYNRVVRAYASILVPLRPQMRLPVQTQNRG